VISLSADTAAVRAIIGGLVIVQIILDVVALRVLFTTPPERLRYLGRWPWAAVILFVSTIGPILFLAMGRHPAPVADPLRSGQREGPHPAIDVLYGKHNPAGGRNAGAGPDGTHRD